MRFWLILPIVLAPMSALAHPCMFRDMVEPIATYSLEEYQRRVDLIRIYNACIASATAVGYPLLPKAVEPPPLPESVP